MSLGIASKGRRVQAADVRKPPGIPFDAGGRATVTMAEYSRYGVGTCSAVLTNGTRFPMKGSDPSSTITSARQTYVSTS